MNRRVHLNPPIESKEKTTTAAIYLFTQSKGFFRMAPERLSSRKSFSLKEEFLDTSNSLVGCVLHQNIIVFIQVLYANEQTEFTA